MSKSKMGRGRKRAKVDVGHDAYDTAGWIDAFSWVCATSMAKGCTLNQAKRYLTKEQREYLIEGTATSPYLAGMLARVQAASLAAKARA